MGAGGFVTNPIECARGGRGSGLGEMELKRGGLGGECVSADQASGAFETVCGELGGRRVSTGKGGRGKIGEESRRVAEKSPGEFARVGPTQN